MRLTKRKKDVKEMDRENSLENEKLDETMFSFAFVCRGTLEQYEDIRSYILRMSGAKLIYQTKSFDRLRIMREDNGGQTRNTGD